MSTPYVGFSHSTLASCPPLAEGESITCPKCKEHAAARARMMANEELGAALLADAQRRGQDGIDWAEYFRNVGVV